MMRFLAHFFSDGLHSAIKRGDLERLGNLLADGSDPNTDSGLITPLMTAARVANVEAVNLLLDKGADLEARDRQGNTALMLAAGGWGYKGTDRDDICLEVVKLLVAKGADCTVCGRRGQTAMRYALGASNKRVMAYLREQGATDSWYTEA